MPFRWRAEDLNAASDSARPTGPALLQHFALASLLATIVGGGVVGAVAVRVVEEYVLDQHAHSAAVYVSEFLAPRLVATDFLSPPPARRVEFEFAMRELIGKTGILRVTVWNPRGQVLYSDAPDLVGRAFPLSQPLESALGGRIQSRILSLSQSRGTRRAMEVFVPVILGGTGRPVAAYDILSDMTSLDSTMSRLRWSLWSSVVLGVLVLYLALFSIVGKASRELGQQHATLQRAFAGSVQSLITAVNARDMATAGHSDHVAQLAVAIAEAAGLNQQEVVDVRIAALLHDVGKIGIPDNILDKPGPLTRRERAAMQRHVVVGYEILAPVAIPEAIKLGVRHHHEWWDGTGYPDGLAGESIPIAARVIAVADAYGTLTTDRPYRPARAPEQAAAEIERAGGTQFDPTITAAFARVWREWRERPAVAPLSVLTTSEVRA